MSRRQNNDDGRWTRQCKLCGTDFFQRIPSQEYCSQACSNKASPGVGGRKPVTGLGKRDCPTCGAEFQPYRSNQFTCSRKCYQQQPSVRERQNAARRTDGERARRNQWRRMSPQQQARVRAYNRKRQIARYGITVEDYDRMLAAQNGVCMLCGSPPNPDGIRAASKLHIDHDHETGACRDLLCLACNHGLGAFKDNPGLLRAAAEYIERHRAAAPPS